MRWSNLYVIFLREVLDQIRDRRTLFVNIVLPMLLYPLLLLFALQIAQLTRTQKIEPALVALVDAPHRFVTGFSCAVVGEAAGVTSADATPLGTSAAIVPTRAAEAAATPSLRTMAHPLWFGNG